MILVGMIFWLQTAGAVTLNPIVASTEKALPVDSTQPNIPCDQIASRLTDYNSMARQHDLSVANFLAEVTGKMNEWYGVLSPLEGSQEKIGVGVFAPLQDGADKISQVTDLAWENSALLANEMDRIQNSLKDCVLTKK